MTPEDSVDGGSLDGKIEQAKDVALGAHTGNPTAADEVGEAAGGISGVLVGAGIGSAAGPVGTLIGGIAGAIGGWWAGRAVSEAAERLTESDESYYKHHFHSLDDRPADIAYGDVRGAYYLGQIASGNPNFMARAFEDVEPELEEGWTKGAQDQRGWNAVRPFVAQGYYRGVERRSKERLGSQLDPEAPGERRE